MSQAPYSIDLYQGDCIVRIVVQGFWGLTTVASFRGAFAAAEADLARFGARRGPLLVLLDARAMRTQSQEVMGALQAAFVAERETPTRSAVIVESALLRLQLQRVTRGERRLFADENDAVEWLLSEGHTT